MLSANSFSSKRQLCIHFRPAKGMWALADPHGALLGLLHICRRPDLGAQGCLSATWSKQYAWKHQMVVHPVMGMNRPTVDGWLAPKPPSNNASAAIPLQSEV